MDHKDLQSAMRTALEDEMPSAQIQLWPAVKDLVAGKFVHRQGVTMNPRLTVRVFRAAILSVLALGALVLATPQGRSFAQSLFQFFLPAPGTSFPVPDSQMSVEPAPGQPTASAPAPLITVAEAEQQAGFDAIELSYVPQGLHYLGARLYGKTINIEYETPGHESHLFISQSPDGYLESIFGTVPDAYVVPVMIGDVAGEFTQGTFVVPAGSASATWDPDFPMRRLRWVANGVWFEIQAIGYLDQAGLITLAEDLMGP